MKVGILTLPLWHNYGGILQAFALREAIERVGVDVFFIDVHREDESVGKRIWKGIKRSVKFQVLHKKDSPFYPNPSELSYISINTRAFVNNKITPSLGPVTFRELRERCHDFDALVVGSDQVWRPEYAPRLESYFLDFLDADTRKISYAASLGTADWRFSEEQTARCAGMLKTFDAVSVREETALRLVAENLGVFPEWVCDPTLLLNKEDYISLIPGNLASEAGNKTCFMYVLDPNEGRVRGLSDLVSKSGFSSFEVMPKPFDKNFSSSKKDYVFPCVEDWLAAFGKCDLVVTDSFHGCVFSIIFNKPFVAIANAERGRARFESLLGSFQLLDRLVSSQDEIDEELLHKPLDWRKINALRLSMQNDGFSFIRRSLGIGGVSE